MAKDLRISLLLDFYGEMLTAPQREMIDAYYNEDMSLGEIGEERNITRQGVRDAVKRAEEQLIEMEQKLGLVKKFLEMRGALEKICDCALAILDVCSEDDNVVKDNAERILSIAEEIASKEQN